MSTRRIPLQAPLEIIVNMAMTADGKITSSDRTLGKIGSDRDHQHLLELRATADAVMCGARTADENKITMGTGGQLFERLRLRRRLPQHPLRIIVTGSGSLDTHAEVFRHHFSPLIVLTTGRATKRAVERLCQAADEVRICGRREIDWPATLNWLRDRWNVKRLLCEGGGELNDAMFRANLVDELHLTLCPKILGGRIAPTISDGVGVKQLTDAAKLEIKSFRRIGDELYLLLRRRTIPPSSQLG